MGFYGIFLHIFFVSLLIAWYGLSSVTVHPSVAIRVESVSMGSAAGILLGSTSIANLVTRRHPYPVVDGFRIRDQSASQNQKDQTSFQDGHFGFLRGAVNTACVYLWSIPFHSIFICVGLGLLWENLFVIDLIN